MYLQLVATKQIVILLLAKEKNKKEIVATLLILSLPEPKEVYVPEVVLRLGSCRRMPERVEYSRCLDEQTSLQPQLRRIAKPIAIWRILEAEQPMNQDQYTLQLLEGKDN
jgi:hypothetical protein